MNLGLLAVGYASGSIAGAGTAAAAVVGGSDAVAPRWAQPSAVASRAPKQWQSRLQADLPTGLRAEPAVINCDYSGALEVYYHLENPHPPDYALTYGDAYCVPQRIKHLVLNVGAAKNGREIPQLDNGAAYADSGLINLDPAYYQCGDCSGVWTLKSEGKFYKYRATQVLAPPSGEAGSSCTTIRDDQNRVIGWRCTAVGSLLIP